jgi:glutamate N-acetyltransferase/amino-acid N-acetyltransferase
MADRECKAAVVYTTNKVKAAPILLTMENMKSKNSRARGIIANSGNANACAPGGMEAAKKTLSALAEKNRICTGRFYHKLHGRYRSALTCRLHIKLY